jgi:hypothetical protein
MFRTIRTFLPSLAVLLLVAACSDLPTSTIPPAADLDFYGPIQENSVECGTETNPCLLPPVGNDPGDSDPVCDPYLTLNGCGDECVEGTPGSPEVVGAEGCYDPGGTGPGDGGLAPPPPGGSTPPSADPYAEGPGAWIACIGAGLAYIGSAALSFVQYYEYYDATTAYAVARLKLQYATPENRYQLEQEFEAAKSHLNRQTVNLAGYVGVTTGAFATVVALCSPSVLFPTP